MRDVDQVERRRGDEILSARLRANVIRQMGQQCVGFRLIEPDAVRHRRVDIHDHDMAPVRNRQVTVRDD